MAGNKSQSYYEYNRIVGYFNDRFSFLVRAYAYSKNIKKSEAVVLMCRSFIEAMPEGDRERMIQNYVQDCKLQEVPFRVKKVVK